ncbi:MAG: translocation/assembly module TamB domain-containing protein [Gammaproteobacteria bacterium]
MHWRVRLPSAQILTGKGESRGNLDRLTLRQDLSGALQLHLKAEARELQSLLRPPVQGAQHSAPVTGQVEGVYPQQGPFSAAFQVQLAQDLSVHIEQLTLKSALHDTTLHASGQWTPGSDLRQGGSLTLALDWQNLRWPLAGTPWFQSASGEAHLDGNLDRYHITLATDRPWPQAPPSHWQARANGNRSGLHFERLHITGLEGETLTLNGQLDWSPHLAWQASVVGKRLNPAVLWPEWPGQLQASITTSGTLQDDRLSAQADIAQLTGTLRGNAVRLRSQLGWVKTSGDKKHAHKRDPDTSKSESPDLNTPDPNTLDQDQYDWTQHQLEIKHFELQSGNAKVSAQGRLGAQLKLDWSLNAAKLSELYPGARGALQASGRLGGTPALPLIQAQLDGKALQLAAYRVGKISGKLSLDLFRWQQVELDLNAEGLRLHEHQLDSLSLLVDPQQLHLKAVAAEHTALLQLRGDVVAATNAAATASATGWRGHIERLEFDDPASARWQLQHPVALQLSQDAIVLERLCLQGQGASVCTGLQYNGSLWRAQLDGDKLPLQLFSPWLPEELRIDGVANTRATLQFDAARPRAPDQLLAQLHIDLPPGAISYPAPAGERAQWAYHAGSVDLSIDPRGLQTHAKLTTSDGDQLQAQLALPEVQLLNLDRNTQEVEGSIKLQMTHLGIIEALLPEVQALRGELALNFSVGATLAEPRYTGNASLSQAALRIPRLGLQLDNIQLRADSDARDKVRYELSAHSGDGELRLQGQTTLDPEAGWPSTLQLSGKDFEVARIPEARVSVTPTLEIQQRGRTLNISGKVHIPFARLQPKDVTSAAQVSNDVVIVGDEQAPADKWLITTQVRLTLGERVSFYGFGFEGRFGGGLLLQDVPGQLTSATGEITIVEGRYTAYGQRLNVEHGRLLYTGGPISNPGLDLRAVRQVSNVTAGIRVRGSLNQPVIDLFSIPAMGQTDALSYLMLGRPLETASGEEGSVVAKAALALSLTGGDSIARQIGDRFGLDEMRVESSDTGEQASLVMGRYLSPKLYISYGVGLIEAFNTLGVRYQISNKWHLKGESGEHQSADILYTIDR